MTQNATAQVVTPPVPGSPEYDAAMIAVAERGGVEFRIPTDPENKSQTAVVSLTQTPEEKATADAAAAAAAAAAKPQRPEWCPEKFWNAETGVVNQEAMAKSYTEIEKRKPAPAPTPVAPVKTEAQTAAEAKLAAATDDATKAAAQVELDAANAAAKPAPAAAPQVTVTETVAAASAEFAEKGEMSPETYAKLEAQGLSREYVNAYVDGLQARAEVVTAKVYDAAGGQEHFAAIKEWAAANLSEQEIVAANTAINSGNLDAVIGQVKSLRSAYEAANGTEGRRVEGKGGAAGVTSVAPYRTKSEVTAAMSDSRYKSDPTYRKEVESKIASAMKANIDLGF